MRRHLLSWQLLTAVLSIYFAITFLVTLVQMGVEYQDTRQTIRSELASIERTFSPALATALWELNLKQLEALHQGIMELPVVSKMRVVDAGGRALIDGTEQTLPVGHAIHTFRLHHRHFSGEEEFLAEVSFESGGEVVLERLRVRLLAIITSALIKSAVLTLLFLWVFLRHLGTPLRRLADAVAAIDLDSLDGKHRLDLQQTRTNELSQLEDAFNRMLTRLGDERRAHDSALEEIKKGLERQVAERTGDLQLANQKLEQLVRTDTLTGAANRRHFVEQAQIEIQRARRAGTPLSLLMMDLDHFKQINDTWGHAAGDEVLRNFSRVTREPLRATDLFARIGGEEFALLLPNTELNGAIEVAQRILDTVGRQSIQLGDDSIRYKVSIGAAILAPQETSYESLLKRADAALYRAKEQGRDQVAAEWA
jgi:diguanylate cyclase (GGDEF)-like protein